MNMDVIRETFRFMVENSIGLSAAEDRPKRRAPRHRPENAGENPASIEAKDLVAQIPDDTIRKLAHEMSLGLDCNVPIMAYRETAGSFLEALKMLSWEMVPPGNRLLVSGSEGSKA